MVFGGKVCLTEPMSLRPTTPGAGAASTDSFEIRALVRKPLQFSAFAECISLKFTSHLCRDNDEYLVALHVPCFSERAGYYNAKTSYSTVRSGVSEWTFSGSEGGICDPVV
jgi:hypothetical protein